MSDPTLEEIWAARQAIWDECNQDLQQLLAFYQQRQAQHPERILTLEEVESFEEV